MPKTALNQYSALTDAVHTQPMPQIGISRPLIAAFVVTQLLAGCATSNVGDRINQSVEGMLSSIGQSKTQKNVTEVNSTSNAPSTGPSALPEDVKSIKKTALAGLFAKHPYDGTSKSIYPRVAVTALDWTRPNCWIARATLWHSNISSEKIQPFAVCWQSTLAFAVNQAVNYQLFMTQSASGHTGNVRGEGPKPPMLAYPLDAFGASQWQKGQDAIAFVEQLLTETGWKPGAPTNIWIVGYQK
ncbi:hypothetical protein [Collimonas sp.]|jgi:hypothetical protein|uniref:hypothetical protein n=1 Tax=Collimonas sp. TaxID=1963772 RepID=UPI002CE4A149|nr:hypothetical protein [Collimonas sp.]HWW05898.1 hypothetical protein [Collimonas sp.]